VDVPDRIVILATDFRPMIGGVADHLHRVADALAQQTRVTVMTSVAQQGAVWDRAYELEPLPPLPQRRLDLRIGDAWAPIRKLHTGLFFLAQRRYADRAIARIAVQPGERTAVLIGIWDTAAHFWCAAARRARVPYYLFAHGVELLIPLYGGLPEWRRVDFQQARGVIANSQATAGLAVERLGLSKMPAIVNPSVGPMPPARDIRARADELRRNLRLEAGPVLLSVGRLVARKGFDLVLRSVAVLREEFPDLTYVIAGDGPERTRLDALVGDLDLDAHVRFLGAIDELTKWAAYELCDLFVMPNRLLNGLDWEGFGIVFLEAALAGRPAIGGRTGGVTDAIASEVTGLLVDPEQQGGLTLAIRRLLDDDALRKRLGAAGEARARDTHNAAATAARMRAQLGWN
jgi:phosphatidylinositol alpha-1,6-mannosyltransferase